MAQMKEQNKTPEKQLNEVEISSLSDAEFKTLVIRSLKELIEYCTSIKKTQAEMKVSLSKVKKNIKRELKRKEKASNQNSKKKKEFKKMRID